MGYVSIVKEGGFVSIYRVCDLNLRMSPRYSELADRAAPFISGGTGADIDLSAEEGDINALSLKTGLSAPLAEYQLSCGVFCEKLLLFDGFVLHASAVLYKGGVYLFSAPSGVGKSTHAALWVKTLGARVINDDKPAIRVINGVPYAYGTPWCGSGYGRLNEKGVVRALYFIRRSDRNFARPMDKSKTPYLLLESMLRPDKSECMDALFTTLSAFVKAVPVFSLDCNLEDGAALTALSAVEG